MMNAFRPHGFLVLLVALVGFGACGDSSNSEQDPAAQQVPATAGDCKAVGEKLADLTRVGLPQLEERERKIVRSQLQLVKEKFTETCQRDKWPADVRACLTGAVDIDAFDACTAPLRAARGLPPPGRDNPAPSQ